MDLNSRGLSGNLQKGKTTNESKKEIYRTTEDKEKSVMQELKDVERNEEISSVKK